MDYEKAYRDALKRAEAMIQIAANKDEAIDFKNTIFPELKESEDERIRNAAIAFVNGCKSFGYHLGISKEDVISWIEKQGEQKHFDKVEPKFKVGDWIVFNNDHNSIYQIEKIENYEYTLRHILGGSMSLSFSHGDMIRAWTIKDAKDGDVLYSHGHNLLWIYKDKNTYHVATNLNYTNNSIDGDIVIPSDVCPATQEQRDLLFNKMHEAGYEWDAEKLELRKIDPCDTCEHPILNCQNFPYVKKGKQKPTNSYCEEHCKGFQETGKCFVDGECKAKRDAEQNPAWSDKDEEMLNGCLIDLRFLVDNGRECNKELYQNEIEWLKGIKNRVQS